MHLPTPRYYLTNLAAIGQKRTNFFILYILMTYFFLSHDFRSLYNLIMVATIPWEKWSISQNIYTKRNWAFRLKFFNNISKKFIRNKIAYFLHRKHNFQSHWVNEKFQIWNLNNHTCHKNLSNLAHHDLFTIIILQHIFYSLYWFTWSNHSTTYLLLTISKVKNLFDTTHIQHHLLIYKTQLSYINIWS